MITNAIIGPCKGCDKRKANCHSTCAEYKQYKMDVAETKAEESGTILANSYVKNRVSSYNEYRRKRH